MALLVFCTSCGALKNHYINKYCKNDTARIDTNLVIHFSVIDTGKTVAFGLDCEHIKLMYDSLLKAGDLLQDSTISEQIKPDTTIAKKWSSHPLPFARIYTDSNYNIYFRPSSKMGSQYEFQVIPIPRKIQGEVEAKFKITLPCKCPPCPELELHWYQKYWYVFAVLALFSSLLILYIKR
jgi:hypothetical protein